MHTRPRQVVERRPTHVIMVGNSFFCSNAIKCTATSPAEVAACRTNWSPAQEAIITDQVLVLLCCALQIEQEQQITDQVQQELDTIKQQVCSRSGV